MSDSRPNYKIGFYDSHHMPSGLTPVLMSFLESGIPTENGVCLCEGREHYLQQGSLPKFAIVHPSYDERTPCPEAIGEVVRAQPGTRFYIPVLTDDIPTKKRIWEAIGAQDNVYCLSPMDCEWILYNLLQELRAPATR